MSTNAVSLHRIIKATPEKVFKAFSDAKAYATWIPPYGFICEIHAFDFSEGGTFEMSFINFTTGTSNAFGGMIQKIRPHEFIQYTDKFEDPNLQGEITTTIRLRPVTCGTEIHVQQDGIPSVIPAEMCYLGWQESLEKLIKLVEPHIPDGN